MLNSPLHRENLNAKAFSNMNGLRLNDICHVNHPIDLSFISNKLRMIQLHDYPLKFMPMCFQPNNLVEFMMPRSCIEKLPEEFSVSFPLMQASAFFFNPPKISIRFLSLDYLISHIYFLSQNFAKLRLPDLSDSKDLVKTPHLAQGMELAKQRQIHLNAPSSLHETSEFSGENFLASYEKAYSMLNLSSSKGEPQPIRGSIGMSESPPFLAGSPRSEDSRELKDQEHIDASKKR